MLLLSLVFAPFSSLAHFSHGGLPYSFHHTIHQTDEYVSHIHNDLLDRDQYADSREISWHGGHEWYNGEDRHVLGKSYCGQFCHLNATLTDSSPTRDIHDIEEWNLRPVSEWSHALVRLPYRPPWTVI